MKGNKKQIEILRSTRVDTEEEALDRLRKMRKAYIDKTNWQQMEAYVKRRKDGKWIAVVIRIKKS